jgi:hypothetical protein
VQRTSSTIEVRSRSAREAERAGVPAGASPTVSVPAHRGLSSVSAAHPYLYLDKRRSKSDPELNHWMQGGDQLAQEDTMPPNQPHKQVHEHHEEKPRGKGGADGGEEGEGGGGKAGEPEEREEEEEEEEEQGQERVFAEEGDIMHPEQTCQPASMYPRPPLQLRSGGAQAVSREERRLGAPMRFASAKEIWRAANTILPPGLFASAHTEATSEAVSTEEGEEEDAREEEEVEEEEEEEEREEEEEGQETAGDEQETLCSRRTRLRNRRRSRFYSSIPLDQNDKLQEIMAKVQKENTQMDWDSVGVFSLCGVWSVG